MMDFAVLNNNRHKKRGVGVSIINLLTPNQSTGGDTLTNTTGFGVDKASITYSTDEHHQGSGSIKVVTEAAGYYNGAGLLVSSSGGQHTITAQVKCPVRTDFRTYINGSTNKDDNVTTGDWQKFTITGDLANGTTLVYFDLVNWSQSSVTYYLDEIQVESGAVAHDWVIGTG